MKRKNRQLPRRFARTQPFIFKLCPDCGYPEYQHRMLGTSVKGEYRLLNLRTKQRCRALVVIDPLTREHRIVSRVVKAVKHIPVGKRRDKRGQGKPR